MNLKAIREKIWLPRNDVDAPSKGILCDWVRDGDDSNMPFIDDERWKDLLAHLPDNVSTNLQKARLSREGAYPIFKAGLGCVDLLSSIIVDGAAVASSSAEAKLAPTLMFGANTMQPSGLPGKHIRIRARGRETTLATAATMTFRFRIAGTDVITGTTIMASGPIAQDAAVYTDTMWRLEGDIVVRVVGSAGTVEGMGYADMSAAAITMGAQQSKYMGSNGSANPQPATWDMNNNQYFQFTGQWSLATAYSIQTHQYTLEALN